MCDDALTAATKSHIYLYLFGTAGCHVLLPRAVVSQLLFCQTANDVTCSLKTDSLYEHWVIILTNKELMRLYNMVALNCWGSHYQTKPKLITCQIMIYECSWSTRYIKTLHTYIAQDNEHMRNLLAFKIKWRHQQTRSWKVRSLSLYLGGKIGVGYFVKWQYINGFINEVSPYLFFKEIVIVNWEITRFNA
jgi:hypothetical protein